MRAILRLKLNVAAALVRGCGAGVRVRVKNYQMQLLLFVAVPVPPAITPNHGPMNRLLRIPVRRNSYSRGRVTSKRSSRKR